MALHEVLIYVCWTQYKIMLFVYAWVLIERHHHQAFAAAVVSVCSSQKHCALGVYMVTETDCQKCVLIQDLWDYSPLPSYSINDLQCIALRHSLFDGLVD